MIELILGYIFIFVARVLDVSMATVRMLMVVRGRRLQAAMIGFFEVMIYIVALGRVVNTLNNPVNLIVYALGFATGNFVGSLVEEKMALGNIAAQVITKLEVKDIVQDLRNQGFGVTVIEGMGKEGVKRILYLTLHRKDLSRLYKVIEGIDPDAFVIVQDARATRGGYFHTMKAK